MERLSKLTDILSRSANSAPAEVFYSKLYSRLRVLEPDNINWTDASTTPAPVAQVVVAPVVNDGKKKKKSHTTNDDHKAKSTAPTLPSPQAASPSVNGGGHDGDEGVVKVSATNGHHTNDNRDDDNADSESDEHETKDTADLKRSAAAATAAASSVKKDVGKKKPGTAAGDDEAARRERAEQRSCARSMCFSFTSDEKPDGSVKKAAPAPVAVAPAAAPAKGKKAAPKAASKAKSKAKAKK